VLEEIQEVAITENGELPMENYPISSKITALEIAVEQSEADHQIPLDSDVAIVDRPQIDSNAELMAKPIDISNYYTGSESDMEWEELSSMTGLPEPPRDIKTDVDDKQSRIYYNAGVVATSSDSLPSRWIKPTEDLSHACLARFRQTKLFSLFWQLNTISINYLDIKNYPVPHLLKTNPE
jgi:hypothetical protein